MKLGFLTACLPTWELPQIAEWAAAHGYRALEVSAWPRSDDRPFTAAQALQWGVANRVCEPGRLLEEALETAGRIAANAPLAVRAIKHAIGSGADHGLGRAMEIELEQYERLFPTGDRLEGVRAFNEKRKPVFRGE